MAAYAWIAGAQPEMAVPRSEGFGGPERADYGGGVALVGVDFGIEVSHFFGGGFVGEIGEGSAIKQAEVHDAGRRGEMQSVEPAPAAEAVGALEEFVAEAGVHFESVGDEVAGVAEMEALGVFAADDHGESVLEAERLGDFQVETLGVALFHAIVDIVWVAARGFVEDGGEGRAGVFDIEVEIPGEERFLAEERAAEIRFAFDVGGGAGFVG